MSERLIGEMGVASGSAGNNCLADQVRLTESIVLPSDCLPRFVSSTAASFRTRRDATRPVPALRRGCFWAFANYY
jgi:hypothetical protein